MISSYGRARRSARTPALFFVLALLALAFTGRAAHAQLVIGPDNGSVTGTLDSTHTSITYNYTVTKDADTTFTLTTSAGVRAQIFFYDKDGTSQIASTNVIQNGSTGTLGIGHLAPGATYFVRAAFYDGSGTFTLSSTVARPAVTNDTEPNNDAAHAGTLPSGGTVTGHLGYSRTSYGDQDNDDYYAFVAPQDSDVTFTLTNDAVFPLRTQIFFYDKDGTTQIASTNVIQAQANGSLGIGHLAPGATYYVRIARYDGYGGYTLTNSKTVPAVANDAEPNDTYKTALTLSLNGSKTGHLGYSRSSYGDQDNEDWYAFTATQDGDVNFTLTNDTVFPLRTQIFFYDSDGTTQIANTNVIQSGSADTLAIGHLAPGATYYVRIVGYDGYGGYTLKNVYTVQPIAGDTEPNNTSAQAKPFALSSTITGHLGYSRGSYFDVDTDDYYTFKAGQDSDVTYTLHTDGTYSLRVQIFFYDVDGTTQIANTNVIQANSTDTLTIGHLSAGATYYVRIARYDGYGSYSLTNAFTPNTTVNDAEPNDTAATAINLHGPNSFTGHLGYSRTAYGVVDGDDYYAITVPQDGELDFSLKGSISLRSQIFFYDVDGTTQITNTNVIQIGDTGTLAIGHLGPGKTYYVRIHQYDGYGGYAVTTTFVPQGEKNDTEPNNDAGHANGFAPDTLVTGHLGFSRTSYFDVDTDDYYSFVAPRDGNATFTLINDLLLRTQIFFYNADGTTQLASTNVIQYGATGSLTIGHLAPGATYYVRVARYDGYGGYVFTNAFAPLFVPNDTENNDTAASAVALANLNNIAGHLGFSRTSYFDLDNDDYYKIALPVGSFSVNVSVTDPLRLQLFLYAPDGTSQLTNTGVISSAGIGTLSANITTAGTYYIRVARYDGYGAYVLNQPVTATVGGFLTLDSIVQGAPQQAINVDFRTPGTTTVLFTRTVSVGFNGNYFIASVQRGKYDLAFKGAKWLRKVIKNVDVNVGDATGVNLFLYGADANNDNVVDIADFGLLVNSYNGDASIPGSGYDVRADFTCDGVVDIGDFGILVNNYNRAGDK